MIAPDISRVVLVGNPDEVHVGSHLLRAAIALGVQAKICDATDAFAAPAWRQKVDWWARGRRPARLREFSAHVVDVAQACRAQVVLTTGIAPVDARALEALGALGIARANFLTDDPWNPAHRAPWFHEALPRYDHVFSPRRATLGDLERVVGQRTSYVPFAYAPDVHFPEMAAPAQRDAMAADVLFAGGADPDRVRMMDRLIKAGLAVSLYGGYWDRFPETRAHGRGMLNASGLRIATGAASVCLCLVRRANRDSHSMRSFEVPAMRGCVVAEDTDDHRTMFGSDGAAASLFRTPDEAVDQIRALLGDGDRRARQATAGHARITGGPHTYRDRLVEMFTMIGGRQSSPASPAVLTS
jgi:spore maturation protein CgeB